jgi:hypothetical protein
MPSKGSLQIPTWSRMQNVAPTYYVFADKSIAMDSGLEHISLPRESQLRIPHISATDLEHHLQTMRMLNPYLYPGTQKSNIKNENAWTILTNWQWSCGSPTTKWRTSLYNSFLLVHYYCFIVFVLIIIISGLTCYFMYSY